VTLDQVTQDHLKSNRLVPELV